MYTRAELLTLNPFFVFVDMKMVWEIYFPGWKVAAFSPRLRQLGGVRSGKARPPCSDSGCRPWHEWRCQIILGPDLAAFYAKRRQRCRFLKVFTSFTCACSHELIVYFWSHASSVSPRNAAHIWKNSRSWNSRDHAEGYFLTVPHPSHFCTYSLQQLHPTSLVLGLALRWNFIPTSGKDPVILSKPPFLVRRHFLVVMSPQNQMCCLCFSRRQLMFETNEGCKMSILCYVCHTVTWLSNRCCMLVWTSCARVTICFMNYNFEGRCPIWGFRVFSATSSLFKYGFFVGIQGLSCTV